MTVITSGKKWRCLTCRAELKDEDCACPRCGQRVKNTTKGN